MLRPKPSGAQVPSFDGVKGRAVGMTLPGGVERRDLASREALVRRMTGEFDDMPGLALSVKQVARLMGVDQEACARILASLTRAGVLQKNPNGYYSRREPGI